MKTLAQRFHFLSAFAAPVAFSLRTGHFRSAMRSRALDRNGRPLPWYSYPAIYYLQQLDFSNADILEFGGGQSTLWWSERAKSVTCLEANKTWSEELSKRLNSRAIVHHVTSPAHSAQTVADRLFDIIIVDDGSGVGPLGRVDNAKTAFTHLKPGGLVIVDNSDAPYSQAIATAGSEGGWSRVDFFGLAPGSFAQYCTSIFFKDASPWLHPAKPPRIA